MANKGFTFNYPYFHNKNFSKISCLRKFLLDIKLQNHSTILSNYKKKKKKQPV